MSQNTETSEWIESEKELPNEDGYFWISDDIKDAGCDGMYHYDGFGFLKKGRYVFPKFWLYIPKDKKIYGKMVFMKNIPNESEHPFPNEELELVLRLNHKMLIPMEDIALIANLIHKYLNLRGEVFHENISRK